MLVLTVLKTPPIISDYKRRKEDGFNKVEYDIEHLDSLENYLVPVFEEDRGTKQTTFKYDKKQFIITHVFDENGPNDATMYGELIPIKVVFRFKKRIKSFSSELDFIKQINKRELEINTNLNKISYGKGTKKVVVSF